MRPAKTRLALLPILKVLAGPAAADFEYADFSSAANLQLNADAVVVGPDLNLTTFVWQGGSAWHTVPQDVASGFETEFRFRLTGNGHGMAFVLQNESTAALGSCGDALGYGQNVTLCGNLPSITNAVVVEFDTAHDLPYGDPNGNHVSVHTELIGSPLQFHTNSLGHTTAVPDLNDGAIHTARIVYATPTLEVYLDDLVTPALAVTVDLPTQILLAQGSDAWAGFTAGTSGTGGESTVLDWSFAEWTGMTGSPDQISLAAGGSQSWQLDAGAALSGLPYLVLGTASGTSPGTTVSGLQLDLNVDAYTLFTVKHPNTTFLSNTLGVLDANGEASAGLNVPAAADPSLVGVKLHHAYLVLELIPGVTLNAVATSNPVAVTLVP